MEIHILKQYYSMHTLCKTSFFIVGCFVSEQKRQVLIEKTRFFGTVFLGGKFSKFLWGRMFAVTFVCGNLYLQITGKIAKIRARKKFCATR